MTTIYLIRHGSVLGAANRGLLGQLDVPPSSPRAGPCAVVAPGGTNRAILGSLLGLPFDRLLAFGQDYAALSVLERAGGRWSLRRLNDAPPRAAGRDPIG